MSAEPRRPISDELDPYVDETEADGLNRLADRLHDERGTPGAEFRAELRARLEEGASRAPTEGTPAQPDPLPRSATTPAPARLRATVAAYACGGLLLLGIAALGLAGAGPLAP